MRLGVSKARKTHGPAALIPINEHPLIKAHPLGYRLEMAVEEESVSLQDIIEEDQELESTANAVFGDSDDSKCSYSKVCLWWNHCALGQCLPPTQGYVGRQALYSCGTCMGKTNEPAGICLACSLHCHEGHELYELYTKRLFCCDCGNSKFQYFTCTLTPVSMVVGQG